MNLPTVPSGAAKVATWSELTDRKPAYALVRNTDLVVIRYDDAVNLPCQPVQTLHQLVL